MIENWLPNPSSPEISIRLYWGLCLPSQDRLESGKLEFGVLSKKVSWG